MTNSGCFCIFFFAQWSTLKLQKCPLWPSDFSAQMSCARSLIRALVVPLSAPFSPVLDILIFDCSVEIESVIKFEESTIFFIDSDIISSLCHLNLTINLLNLFLLLFRVFKRFSPQNENISRRHLKMQFSAEKEAWYVFKMHLPTALENLVCGVNFRISSWGYKMNEILCHFVRLLPFVSKHLLKKIHISIQNNNISIFASFWW